MEDKQVLPCLYQHIDISPNMEIKSIVQCR
jgi:hypothetical protein